MLFERKADADRHDVSVRGDIARGQYVDPRAGKLTLRTYGTTWLAGQTFDPSTREAVELRLRVHVYPVLGDVELRALAQRPSLVQSWIRGLQGQLAPNYCRTVFANLSAVLTAAVDDGLIVRNPCRAGSVRPPAPDRRKVQPWAAKRVYAVREGLPDRYASTVDAGAGLGLRQGEVFGLSPDDVDWLRRVVHVRRQIKYVGARLVFAPPKGGKERDVPLPEAMSLRLAAHLQEWPAQAITLPWLVPPPARLRLHPGGPRQPKLPPPPFLKATPPPGGPPEPRAGGGGGGRRGAGPRAPGPRGPGSPGRGRPFPGLFRGLAHHLRGPGRGGLLPPAPGAGYEFKF